MTAPPSAATTGALTIDRHWQELVTVSLLGTDRRDPPAPVEALADLVADTARTGPSERMLAQVAACTAVRRAAFLPGPPLAPLAPPFPDPRPVCPDEVAGRWRHITVSWPVLEDEWFVLLIRSGWRAAPDMVPEMLRRHRGDPVRRARVEVAAGDVARWLVESVPALAATRSVRDEHADAVDTLPDLPIPPDLAELFRAPERSIGSELASELHAGRLGHAHRGVLANGIARVDPERLSEIARGLERLDAASPAHGTAQLLADLARTRHRMTSELARIDATYAEPMERQ